MVFDHQTILSLIERGLEINRVPFAFMILCVIISMLIMSLIYRKEYRGNRCSTFFNGIRIHFIYRNAINVF
jgi:hypothetical protein